jgi:hypothetical protein
VPGVPGLWRFDFIERMSRRWFISPAGSSRVGKPATLFGKTNALPEGKTL